MWGPIRAPRRRKPPMPVTGELVEKVQYLTKMKVCQREIVERTGLSQSSISRIQNNRVGAGVGVDG